MNFPNVKDATESLRTLLREATGRELIAVISLEEPSGIEDELYFFKLVTWSYVFLVEAGQSVVRHLLSLLRVSRPEQAGRATKVRENVINLRTVRTHNLLPESNSDRHKMRQATIWLIENGGNPCDYSLCCKALCTEVVMLIDLLAEQWRYVTEVEQDRKVAVSQITEALDNNWPPHVFDRLLEDAAATIGLSDLNVVKYRQDRIQRWRELVGYFETREIAELAIKNAIITELKSVFGQVQKGC